MSLILKGIDLPETKDDRYIIQVYKSGDVYIGKETWDDTKKGRDKIVETYLGEYHAIQIPKGHGRLIDGDAMQRKAFDDNFKYKISERDLYVVNVYIEHAPVILEAKDTP